jgi:hypothetical protein
MLSPVTSLLERSPNPLLGKVEQKGFKNVEQIYYPHF